MFSFGMAPRVMGDPYDCILYVNTEEYYRKKIKQYPKMNKAYFRYCAQEWSYMGYSDGFDKVSAFLTDYFGDMDFYDELEEDLYSAFAEGFSKLIKEGKLMNKNGEQLFMTFCCDECFLPKNIYIDLIKKLNDDSLERQKYIGYIEENYDE